MSDASGAQTRVDTEQGENSVVYSDISSDIYSDIESQLRSALS